MMKLSFHPLLPALLATLLQFFAPRTVARAEETYVAHACYSFLSYTSNSVYETNLHSLMSSLTSQNGVSNGFYKASEGENDQDAVAGYALCRGDVSQSACNSCVNISTADILQMCSTQIGAIAWYENCMLSYSPSFISGYVPPGEFYYPPADQLQDDPVINASDLGKYYEARDVLLSTLAKRASTGNTHRYVLVIILLTVCCMLLIASLCIFLCLMRRKEKTTNVNAPRSVVPSPYGLQNIRVDTYDERLERRGDGAAASKGRPIMQRQASVREMEQATHGSSRLRLTIQVLDDPLTPPDLLVNEGRIQNFRFN